VVSLGYLDDRIDDKINDMIIEDIKKESKKIIECREEMRV